MNISKVGGKFMYAIPFVIFGIFQLLNAADLKAKVPVFIPGGVFWVYVTGVALIAGGLAILIDKKAKLACQLLALLLLIFSITVHLMAVFKGNDTSMPHFLKDFSLSGAALYLSAHLTNEK